MRRKEDRKQYYEKIFSENKEELWEKAPGKDVILSALHHYYKNGKIPENAKIVDIGCGSGFFLNRVFYEVEKNKFQLYGIDFSSRAIEKAKKKYPLISFYCENGANTHFDENEFDILISYGTYEHFQDPQEGIAEAARILRSGGYFFCMMPTLGIDRTDRDDEGWYKEREVNGSSISQLQWNLKRHSWEAFFQHVNLKLFPQDRSAMFGAIKPGVFFFGEGAKRESSNKQ